MSGIEFNCPTGQSFGKPMHYRERERAVLPAHFPASVFVVLHIPAHKPSALPTLLCHAGPLRTLHPIDNALIERKRIYVAPPDCHLLVEVGQVRLSKGLKEKGTRPCLFYYSYLSNFKYT